MLKTCIHELASLIHKLFNAVFESGTFPTIWNQSYQVPLYKSGDKLECNNYRGISICSCLCKLFTSIMQTHLLHFLENNKKISKHQAAFRPGHSTSDHIFTLKSIINKYVMGNKGKLYTCFVDFRRAFDSIWREGMLVKMLRLGLGGKFYNIIKNM